ncbi:hypothetical protein TKK_0016570 [Trichogramma kaykai]|uniref:YqaJ viral recombinase domain-containing protein n=1 Tax=Trichogramma kaykai TaxID=54128 RepID=A0ABD2W6B9_9HYME
MANKLEVGFTKADTKNLPTVSGNMIFDFITNDDRFNAPEVRGVKNMTSSRESYGDNAIGYVCVKRENSICTLKAQICPEHRVREKSYLVSLVVDEEKNLITNAQCFDCAAAEGGCKHAFAFIMWVHRRSEEKSPTDTICYWKKSILSNVGTKNKFILCGDINPLLNSKTDVNFTDSNTFFNSAIEKLKENQVDSHLSKYTITLNTKQLYSASIHQMLLSLPVEQISSVSDFIDFASNIISEDLRSKIQISTLQQNKSFLWYELRYGRITASIIHEAAHCQTSSGSLVKKILGASKKYLSAAMTRGSSLEEEVFIELKRQGHKIEKCGLFLIAPIFGASPDGIGEDFIVEIKYPSSENNFLNYICNGNISEKYKAQMMLQMKATNKNKGVFCVADSKFEENKVIHQYWINYDAQYTNNLIVKAKDFWEKNIYPLLVQDL